MLKMLITFIFIPQYCYKETWDRHYSDYIVEGSFEFKLVAEWVSLKMQFMDIYWLLTSLCAWCYSKSSRKLTWSLTVVLQSASPT